MVLCESVLLGVGDFLIKFGETKMNDFVSIIPKENTYEVRNHNGALMGFLVWDEIHKEFWLRPLKDWTDYSMAQLDEIVSLARKIKNRM